MHGLNGAVVNPGARLTTLTTEVLQGWAAQEGACLGDPTLACETVRGVLHGTVSLGMLPGAGFQFRVGRAAGDTAPERPSVGLEGRCRMFFSRRSTNDRKEIRQSPAPSPSPPGGRHVRSAPFYPFQPTRTARLERWCPDPRSNTPGGRCGLDLGSGRRAGPRGRGERGCGGTSRRRARRQSSQPPAAGPSGAARRPLQRWPRRRSGAAGRRAPAGAHPQGPDLRRAETAAGRCRAGGREVTHSALR
ncbi:hypothetical protein [Deinococcus hopiensis]|uniref:hypothetical protein n=1 Tax=Deinococcus hopiensis TaxID=309885 RepID=UPI003CCB7BC6